MAGNGLGVSRRRLPPGEILNSTCFALGAEGVFQKSSLVNRWRRRDLPEQVHILPPVIEASFLFWLKKSLPVAKRNLISYRSNAVSPSFC